MRLAWLTAAATALVVLASALGLLCQRLGVFDDSALLLGARLVRAGKLPYRDFYTHYGPLGYAALAPVLGRFGNAGLTLRLAEAATLATLAVLLLLAFRRPGGTADRSDVAIPLAALALSPTMASSSFEGFGFSTAALLLYVVARRARGLAGGLGIVTAAAMLAAAALTRPAFAVYAGVSILVVELTSQWGNSGRTPDRRPLVFFAAAIVAIPLAWVALFPDIPPRVAAEATLATPARLIESGGRAIPPDFMTAPFPASVFLGGILAAVPILWSFGARPGARFLSAAAIATGALTPILLGRSGLKPMILTALAVIQFGLAVAITFRLAPTLRSAPRLWAAALLGLAASAYGHYFWSRPDQQHLFPLLALGAISAAFSFDRFSWKGRVVVVGIFAIAFLPVGPRPETGFPAASVWNGGWTRVLENAASPGARLRSIWPCGEVPSHAAAAVELADLLGGPSSRFVAYGSSQAWSSGNPVYLFLLSSRLPYTKWYAYDPGLQSSAPIQALMVQDLENSGSRTAVVWHSEQFMFDQQPPDDLGHRSAFDREADRLYGRVIGIFGNYEVRSRIDPSTPKP